MKDPKKQAQQPPPPPAPEAEEQASEAPLSLTVPFEVAKLEDRVVCKLLFEGRVQQGQVEGAWQRWHARRRSGEREALWRELAEEPTLSREMVFEEAALVYDFKPVDISVMRTLIFIQQLEHIIDDSQWNALIELSLIPVVERGMEPGQSDRMIFATNDPTDLHAHRVLRKLNIGPFEIRYAPEKVVRALIAEFFPRKQYLVRGSSRRYLRDPNAADAANPRRRPGSIPLSSVSEG